MGELISIILPVYNSEKFIGRTLTALCNQTYKNIEVLCIDDGSEDNSLKIIREYEAKDIRIRVFTQKNSGPARARNVGLENIRGEYTMFCDSDDWYDPEMCEIMLRTIKEKKVDFVMCQARIHQMVINQMGMDKIIYERIRHKGLHFLNDYLRKDINVFLWNKIFKTAIIKFYEIDFPDGYEHDDVAFVYEYMCSSLLYFGIEKELYNHVIRENSIMDNTYNKKSVIKKYDILHALNYVKEFLIKKDLMTKNKKFFLAVLAERFQFQMWKFLDNKKEKVEAIQLCHLILADCQIEELKFSKILTLVKKNKIWLLISLLDDVKWVRFIRRWKERIHAIWCLNPFSLGYLVGEYRDNMQRQEKQSQEMIALLHEHLNQLSKIKNKIDKNVGGEQNEKS